MKYLLFLILLLFNQECSSQKLKINNKQQTMESVTVNNSSETFNEVKSLLAGSKTPVDNKNNYEYNYKKENSNEVLYAMGQPNIYYATVKYLINSNYAIKKVYHGNGMIKEKGVFFNGNDYTKLGLWYEFDDKGKLTKEINHNDGYKFPFQEVLRFCQLKNIKVIKGDMRKLEGGFYTDISKREINGKKVWVIKYQDGIKNPENVVTDGNKTLYKSIYEEIILDGETGNIISEKTIN